MAIIVTPTGLAIVFPPLIFGYCTRALFKSGDYTQKVHACNLNPDYCQHPAASRSPVAVSRRSGPGGAGPPACPAWFQKKSAGKGGSGCGGYLRVEESIALQGRHPPAIFGSAPGPRT